MKDKNFWKTDKGNSLIKLVLWLLFVLFLVMVFAFNENKIEKNEEEKKVEEQVVETEIFKPYDEMQKNILSNGYQYTYEIIGTDFKFTYTGSVCNNKNIGFKESNAEIIKYFIKDGMHYQVKLDTLEQINNLYENIDSSFLDINLLFNNLKNNLYKVIKSGDTRTINYNKDGYQVSVNTSLDNITQINIESDNIKYNLYFANIGYCAKIDFE